MKTIRKLVLVLFVLSGIKQVVAQDAILSVSLEQACKLGLENNLEVVNASLEKQKSAYAAKELRSGLYPHLEAYSDFNYYYAIPKMLFPGEFFGETGDIAVEIGTKYDWISGFNASLTLYNQSYYTSLKVAKQMQNMSELSLQQKKEEIVYMISQVYFLCKTTQSQVALLQKNMQNTINLLKILKSQSENGVARKIDYSKVLVNKNNLQTEIDNLDKLYWQQLGLLKYLMGFDNSSEVELSDSLSFSQTIQTSKIPDFNIQSEFQLLDKQIELAVLNKKANQQSYLPSLSLSGQYYYDGQQNDFNFFSRGSDKFFKVGVVALNLTIPIFDGFEKHSKTQQYNVELQQLQNNRKNLTKKYTTDFTDAINQYNISQKALLRQQENIKIAEEDYAISLQQYDQQFIALPDLMLSENLLTEARLSYVNALLQLKNAGLDMKKAKGELLSF